MKTKKSKKSEFYKNKQVTKIDEINANKILVSKKESYGTKNSFKYFIGYLIKLPLMTGYARNLMIAQQCLLRLTINNF